MSPIENEPVVSDAVAVHPITEGVNVVYARNHTPLTVENPPQSLVTIGGRTFIALYDGQGTLVAIGRIGFHWQSPAAEVEASDNFVFWRNLLHWLAGQPRSKRRY